MDSASAAALASEANRSRLEGSILLLPTSGPAYTPPDFPYPAFVISQYSDAVFSQKCCHRRRPGFLTRAMNDHDRRKDMSGFIDGAIQYYPGTIESDIFHGELPAISGVRTSVSVSLEMAVI